MRRTPRRPRGRLAAVRAATAAAAAAGASGHRRRRSPLPLLPPTPLGCWRPTTSALTTSHRTSVPYRHTAGWSRAHFFFL